MTMTRYEEVGWDACAEDIRAGNDWENADLEDVIVHVGLADDGSETSMLREVGWTEEQIEEARGQVARGYDARSRRELMLMGR